MDGQRNIGINLYQNNLGEICAFIGCDDCQGNHCYKLVKNVDRFAKTSSLMLDYLLDGFSGFFDFDLNDYNEKHILNVLEEMTEEGTYKLIVHFEFEGISADYYFENMNNFTIVLFLPIKEFTDQKAIEYEQRLR